MSDLYKTESVWTDVADKQRGGGSPNANPPTRRPFSDTGNLNEIPRVRPEDPPMRHWWRINDEPQRDN